MKTLLLASLLALPVRVWGQANAPKHLYIEPFLLSSVVGSANCVGGACLGSGTGLRRDLSLEATKGFTKNCPAIAVTNNRESADYTLRISPGSSTLFKQNGDVAYISPAKRRVANLVKDVCGYVKEH